MRYQPSKAAGKLLSVSAGGWKFHHKSTSWLSCKALHAKAPRSRASSTSCAAQAGARGLPFLSRLDEQTAPAIKALEGQEQPFAIMRRAQHEILHALSDQLGLEGQATTVSDDGLKIYNTEDGLSSIALQVGAGRDVEWLVASSTALLKFGGGTIRINAFPSRATRVPKLDVELFYFFGQINMYVNFAARTDLVLNEDYLTRYYKTRGSCGQSIQDLQLECMEDPELSPFESRSIDMRVLTGQTSLFCKARATEENVEKMADFARRASGLWLEFAAAADAVVRGDEAAAVAEDLRRHDEALYGFARRDPDNAKVAPLVGEAALEEMLQLQTRDRRILLL